MPQPLRARNLQPPSVGLILNPYISATRYPSQHLVHPLQDLPAVSTTIENFLVTKYLPRGVTLNKKVYDRPSIYYSGYNEKSTLSAELGFRKTSSC